MRRSEIKSVLAEAIGDEFDDEAAEAFDLNDLDNIARMIQDEYDPDDAFEVTDRVRQVYKNARDRDLDMLADGEMDNPNGWLYNRLAGR